MIEFIGTPYYMEPEVINKNMIINKGISGHVVL